MKPIDPIAFIRANLPVVPVPDIPEIRLHRASSSSGLGRLAMLDEQGFGSPYWAFYWAGGLALARFILDRPDLVAGRRVLDLGAGSGLVAIAAAMAGAREVIAADVDRYAVTALALNAAHNQVSVTAVHGDPTTSGPPSADLVLVGDLFYERDLADRVTAFLDRCLAVGIGALVGDPRRGHLPASRLTLLAEYEVAETAGAAGKPGAVFAFEGNGTGSASRLKHAATNQTSHRH